jgi:hypothetical protein
VQAYPEDEVGVLVAPQRTEIRDDELAVGVSCRIQSPRACRKPGAPMARACGCVRSQNVQAPVEISQPGEDRRRFIRGGVVDDDDLDSLEALTDLLVDLGE